MAWRGEARRGGELRGEACPAEWRRTVAGQDFAGRGESGGVEAGEAQSAV